MKTSAKFDQVIQKLYQAFHSDRLNPFCCKQCAVGNILDNRDFWRHFAVAHGTLQLSYVGQVNEAFNKKFSGFSPSELLQIEVTFLKACGFDLPIRSGFSHNKPTKDELFNGLAATVELLCEFENIPNIMDCSKLFDFEPHTVLENHIPETVID